MRKIILIALLVLIALPAYGADMNIKSPKTGLDKHLDNRLRKIERMLETLQNGSTDKAQTQNEFANQYGSSEIQQFQRTPQIVLSDTGDMEIYDQETGDQIDVTLPDNAKVYGTKAGQTIPSSYFLDLRGSTLLSYMRHYTADWLTLHDSSTPQKVIAVTNVNVTFDLSVIGANGKDRAGPFSGWNHGFVIYNLATGTAAALASPSATTPILPTGYDYFVRVGAFYVAAGPAITTEGQIGDMIWHRVSWAGAAIAVSVANTWENLDISSAVPPTAKVSFGQFGLYSDPSTVRGFAIASDVAGTNDIQGSFDGPPASGYAPKGPVTFQIPITASQTIYRKSDVTSNIWMVTLYGFQDDL